MSTVIGFDQAERFDWKESSRCCGSRRSQNCRHLLEFNLLLLIAGASDGLVSIGTFSLNN